MSEIIHLRKFDGGRRTPAEMHRQYAFAGRSCSACGDPPALMARFLASVPEFKRRHPELWDALVIRFRRDPTIETTYGPMVLVEVAFACENCKKGLEVLAARKPDWVLVEWDRMGLESTHAPLIQIPRGHR